MEINREKVKQNLENYFGPYKGIVKMFYRGICLNELFSELGKKEIKENAQMISSHKETIKLILSQESEAWDGLLKLSYRDSEIQNSYTPLILKKDAFEDLYIEIRNTETEKLKISETEKIKRTLNYLEEFIHKTNLENAWKYLYGDFLLREL